MKESIEAWSDDADVELVCCCKWTVTADPGLSLICDLATELVIEQACDEILSEVWFARVSNAVNINCSEICFLMTDRMRVLDSHLKWCDEISVLLLFFAFVTDEIEIDREFLKTIIF